MRIQTAILIPAYKPAESMLVLIRDLQEEGFDRILAVDDGSGEEFRDLFEKAAALGAAVERHPVNRGKGAAIRTGIRAVRDRWGEDTPLVTADADGQHLPEDIRRVAEALAENPGALVLGVRDFTSPEVPFRSRFGNQVTAVFFRISSGVSCPDTQTGLRGIPPCLYDLALETEGDRYEYEMTFLSEAVRRVPLVPVPIRTVYEEGNASSHFRPVRDSLRIYGRPLKFAAASLAGAAVDLGLFHVLDKALAGSLGPEKGAAAAVVAARICSGSVNFLLNKYWCFSSRRSAGPEAGRYLVLFIGQMGASAVLTVCLVHLGMPGLGSKVLTDTGLFLASYQIQKRWVFSAPVKGQRKRL